MPRLNLDPATKERPPTIDAEYEVIYPEVDGPIEVLPAPLRYLDPAVVHHRKTLMRALNDVIPVNEFNLPVFIYRSDMIPQEVFAPLLLAPTKGQVQAMIETLEAAVVYLDYDQGYPELPSGMPLWNKLPWEPISAHTAFKQYLDLGGIRQLHLLTSWPIDDLREYYHNYHWEWRLRTFDLYIVANNHRLRVQRSITSQDRNFQTASALLEKIVDMFEDPERDFMSEMSPFQAISAMEKLVKIQRLSLNLEGTASIIERNDKLSTPEPTEVMRTVTDNNIKQIEHKQTEVKDLLNNPDMLEAAQKLVILRNQAKTE